MAKEPTIHTNSADTSEAEKALRALANLNRKTYSGGELTISLDGEELSIRLEEGLNVDEINEVLKDFPVRAVE
jgi:uncharacterized protein YacL (UPF0231 family)